MRALLVQAHGLARIRSPTVWLQVLEDTAAESVPERIAGFSVRCVHSLVVILGM